METEQIQKIESHLTTNVLPVLTKYGAVEVGRNFDDFYNVLTIEFRGERLNISAPDFERVKPIEWFLKNFDEVLKIVTAFDHMSDPFYSNITEYFKSRWPHVQGNQRDVAFNFVCDKIRKSGKRIWS